MAKKPNPSMFALGLVALALAAVAAPAAAQPAGPAQAAQATLAADTTPPVTLRMSYESRSVGHDGVTRDSRHSDLMVRATNVVWIERELPKALRESEDHGHAHEPGPHAGHAHEDAQGAPLLIQRDAKGGVVVKMVLRPQRRVIEVDPAHYGNAGYGGSWSAAYWLIDPEALPHMEKVGPVKSGVQQYRLRKGEKLTRVDWNVKGRYASLIEQTDAHGLSSHRMTATVVPTPKTLPWNQLEGWGRGDYSDLLD
jgi:hypothetical protein